MTSTVLNSLSSLPTLRRSVCSIGPSHLLCPTLLSLLAIPTAEVPWSSALVNHCIRITLPPSGPVLRVAPMRGLRPKFKGHTGALPNGRHAAQIRLLLSLVDTLRPGGGRGGGGGQSGNVSRARRASFVTRALPVDCCC